MNNNVPIQILLDVVHPSNGWDIILLDENGNKRFIIKKNSYYYELSSTKYFKNSTYKILPIQAVNDLEVNLGEFKPLILENRTLIIIPIIIQNNEYILNIRTNIVYIKPKDLVLGIVKSSTYDYNSFKNYYYGGVYNNYVHSENHTNQLFIDIIPNNHHKTNTPNNFHNKFNNRLNYDVKLTNKSLLGDKLLNSNPYFIMKEPQKFELEKKQIIQTIQKTTIFVPFLNKHTNNFSQLEKTLGSILKFMKNIIVFVVTNKGNFEIDNELMAKINIIRFQSYVGFLGPENRLNLLMKNKCDVGSFYNNLINNYVKTDTFIIWNYNWELYDHWNILESNIAIPIYNYYYHNETYYKSKNYVLCFVLDNKKRFQNSNDLMNITVPVNKVITDILVPIKNIYTELDYEELKNCLTYETSKEVKNFFENIINNNIPDYILQE